MSSRKISIPRKSKGISLAHTISLSPSACRAVLIHRIELFRIEGERKEGATSNEIPGVFKRAAPAGFYLTNSDESHEFLGCFCMPCRIESSCFLINAPVCKLFAMWVFILSANSRFQRYTNFFSYYIFLYFYARGNFSCQHLKNYVSK